MNDFFASLFTGKDLSLLGLPEFQVSYTKRKDLSKEDVQLMEEDQARGNLCKLEIHWSV